MPSVAKRTSSAEPFLVKPLQGLGDILATPNLQPKSPQVTKLRVVELKSQGLQDPEALRIRRIRKQEPD